MPFAGPESSHKPCGLVCIGLLGWDVLVSPSGEKVARPGGSPLHFVAGAAMVGAGPVLIAEADLGRWHKILQAMRALGVDTAFVRHVDVMPHFELHYASDFSVDIDRFVISPGEGLGPSGRTADLDEALSSPGCTYVLICPNEAHLVATYVQAAVGSGARVALQLHLSQLQDSLDLIRFAVGQASLVFLNETEFLALTGASDLGAATRAAPSFGPATWVVTSRRRVTVLSSSGERVFASMLAPDVDPTGAGDALAGGLLGGLSVGASFDQAMRFGLLCATANVSGIGSSNFLRTTGLVDGRDVAGIGDEQWSDTRTLLSGLRTELHEFAVERGWQARHSARSLVDAMVVEVAELMQEFLWLSDRESDTRSLQEKRRIELELADVVIYALNLCNYLGIDLLATIQDKVALNAAKHEAVVSEPFMHPFPEDV